MSLLEWLASDQRVMEGALLTTFPFSPGFFERSALPALRSKRRNIRTAVLMDERQYEDSIAPDEPTETLGQTAGTALGQAYHVSPIRPPTNRTFHPKVHLLTGQNRVQVMVGSGNLTHPGLTTNQEIATQFTLPADPDGDETGSESAATRAMQARLYCDLEEYLHTLLNSEFGRTVDSATRQTIDHTLGAAAWVHDIDTTQLTSTADATRLFHSLSQPILEQAIAAIEDRGEQLQSVDIIAPFYGTSMRVPEYFMSKEIETTLWLQRDRSQLDSDAFATWLQRDGTAALEYDSHRYVHGKLLVFRTEKATYCLSGSPNASQAALLSSAKNGGNIETALFRRKPRLDGFAYLLEANPFEKAIPTTAEDFEPADLNGLFESREPTPTEKAGPVVSLSNVSYHRYGSFDGGTVKLRGDVSPELKSALESGEGTLQIGARQDAPTDTYGLSPIDLEWNQTEGIESQSSDQRLAFEYSSRHVEQEANGPFRLGGVARLVIDGTTSNPRWLQVYTPDSNTATAEELTESGTTAVPEQVFGLYLSEGEDQETIRDSMSALLQALNNRSDADTPAEPSGLREESDSGPRGGLRLTAWNTGSSHDPNDLLVTYLENWQEELRTYVRQTSQSEPCATAVSHRLRAINSVSLQLLILDSAVPDPTVPTQDVVNCLHDVYTDRSEGRVQSLLEQYLYNLKLGKSPSEVPEEIFKEIQSNLLPNLLFAAIVMDAHLADDVDQYHKQYGWAFEQLINECCPVGYPSARLFSSEDLTRLTTQITDATTSLIETIENSARLRRHANSRYLSESRLREAVVEILARSILYAGPEAIREVRDAGESTNTIEHIFDNRAEFLPPGKRRAVESVL
ncbi:hypothetical protein [Salinirubrum litoreum]|uniref:PLD phosphodiesterase domain-containing protein n=1 Tax=Salinirubrum litoreum TaxID=1126234 RepID=A0ABD5RB57_9EURY|nr:hypothetical protein [Salinirubrum litoreum]